LFGAVGKYWKDGKALETVEILLARLFRSGYFCLSSHNTMTVESHTERTEIMTQRKEVRYINHLIFSSSFSIMLSYRHCQICNQCVRTNAADENL
jgi:hypothetical protein